MIAEVHHIKLPDDAPTDPPPEVNSMAEKAAHAPGSEQLLTLLDASTREGLVIHLWKDQASYESFAAGRKELTTESQGLGSQIETGRLYEVTYRS